MLGGVGGGGGGNGETTTTIEVVDIEEVDVPASTFAIPGRLPGNAAVPDRASDTEPERGPRAARLSRT